MPIILLVLAAALFLTVSTVQSGFERVTIPSAPPPPTTTTTTIPLPGSTLPPIHPPVGTWIGSFVPGAPPHTLFGSFPTFPFPEPALDALPDGSLLIIDGTQLTLAHPDGRRVPLPVSGSATIATSPNGQLVAFVDPSGDAGILDLSDESITTFDIPGGAVADPAIHWAPNSGFVGFGGSDRFSVLLTAGDPLLGPIPGRLVALGNLQAAFMTSVGNELDAYPLSAQSPSRSILLKDIEAIAAAAFDPTGSWLAVDAVGTSGERRVSVIGLRRFQTRVIGTDASSLAWSGDGSILYLAQPTGIIAYPIGPTTSAAEGVINQVQPDPSGRLRIYDPALVPLTTPLVDSGRLVERRGNSLYQQDSGGVALLDPDADTAFIQALSVAPVSGRVQSKILRIDRREGATTIAFELPSGQQTPVATVSAAQIPSGEQVIKAASLPGIGIVLETSAKRIVAVTGDSADVASVRTIGFGSSIGHVDAVAFAVSTDGTTLDILDAGEQQHPLLSVSDLDGASRILGAVGVGSDLIVAVLLQTGQPALYLIPPDSDLVRDVLAPQAPSANSLPWSIIYTEPDLTVVSISNLSASPDRRHFVFVTRTDAGDTATILMADATTPAVCPSGGVACLIGQVPDTIPLGFSPDGSWLLVNHQGQLWALSTHGRGVQVLDLEAPQQVAWVRDR